MEAIIEEIIGIGGMDAQLIENWYYAYTELGGNPNRIKKLLIEEIQMSGDFDEGTVLFSICTALKEFIAEKLEEKGYPEKAREVLETDCYINGIDSSINHDVLDRFTEYEDLDEFLNDIINR